MLTRPSSLPLLAQAMPPVGVVIFFLALWIFLIGGAIAFYRGPVRKVARGEGEVAPLPFGMPDVLALVVAGLWMLALLAPALAGGGSGEEGEITTRGMGQSIFLFAIIVGGLAWFMENRRISVAAMLGWRRIGLWKAVLKGALFMLCAYPLVLVCMIITSGLLKDKGTPQKLIEFFHSAVSSGDYRAVTMTVISAVVVAPFVEEFIFRGYIYGVLRRYLGPWKGMLLASLAFAAIHLNILGFPSLFVLALCFTLAYEATGSLLVPMTMHAVFNFVNLIQVFNLASR